LEWQRAGDSICQRFSVEAIVPAADIATASTAWVTVVNPVPGRPDLSSREEVLVG